ncbi:TetR/AcrR family transcriptional regulator [Nocardioides sp.]|uniref:TetR/AcrR family transcriptional regulator n=1 Tax=Nocardioides sp. TaxID=35761 RepID=UPI0026189080|nr:TetR/AcrR family transcriptional regulator [Nocardioides sp.]
MVKTDSPSGATRRQQFSASTRRALLEVAHDLFVEQGYAATSLDAVVAGATVTKGALYHHFTGKQALFEAVFTAVEADAMRTITEAMKDEPDPWVKSQIGLRTFIEAVRTPAYRRIVIQEGPAVLGYERFREHEEHSSYAVVESIVADVLASVGVGAQHEVVTTFARVFFGGLQSAGEEVATASDPEAAASRVEAVVGMILGGLQLLADRGELRP